MNELREEKEEKEDEVSMLSEEMKEKSKTVSDLHTHASMSMNGLSEETVLSEEKRGEELMNEMCSLRV